MKPKKSLGQNFLVDKTKITQIIDLIDIKKNDVVFEVGPGLGALTKSLAPKTNTLIAIEIDQRAILELEKLNIHNLTIIHADVLSFDFKNVTKQYENQKLIFVSNLPYYISTPILFKILEIEEFKEINFMIQKELGDRIKAKPHSKQYGRITVALNTFFDIVDYIDVKSNCFSPKPKVDSIFLKLKRKPRKDIDIIKYLQFVKIAFQFKRKTLINTLSAENGYEKTKILSWIQSKNLSEKVRAEELNIDSFLDLFFYLN